MTKIDIDYSNTIIYKISCKDENVTDVYVGHTTNFVQRKHSHKQGCTNPKSTNYLCKLYNTIRLCGGWSNWKMEIIAFYNCADLLDARRKEQEHFVSLNATLNSIEPLPAPKSVSALNANSCILKSKYFCEICKYSCFNTLDIYNAHFTSNAHIKCATRLNEYNIKVAAKCPLSQKNAPLFECTKCNYKCSKKSDYNKHCLTKKHNSIFCGKNAISKTFKCRCGNVYKHSSSYYRHNKECQIEPSEPFCNGSHNTFPSHVDKEVVIELLKQNASNT